MATFGERLQELRLDNNETQADLAKLLNIGQRMISYYESNSHFPRDEKIIKQLAAHFKVTTDYLLGYANYTGSSAVTNIYNSLPPSLKREADDYMKYLVYKSKLNKNGKNR